MIQQMRKRRIGETVMDYYNEFDRLTLDQKKELFSQKSADDLKALLVSFGYRLTEAQAEGFFDDLSKVDPTEEDLGKRFADMFDDRSRYIPSGFEDALDPKDGTCPRCGADSGDWKWRVTSDDAVRYYECRKCGQKIRVDMK